MVYGANLGAKRMSDDNSPLEQNDRQIKLYMNTHSTGPSDLVLISSRVL
jgi:hypothetical protein